MRGFLSPRASVSSVCLTLLWVPCLACALVLESQSESDVWEVPSQNTNHTSCCQASTPFYPCRTRAFDTKDLRNTIMVENDHNEAKLRLYKCKRLRLKEKNSKTQLKKGCTAHNCSGAIWIQNTPAQALGHNRHQSIFDTICHQVLMGFQNASLISKISKTNMCQMSKCLRGGRFSGLGTLGSDWKGEFWVMPNGCKQSKHKH